jgi:outer membrane usher protein
MPRRKDSRQSILWRETLWISAFFAFHSISSAAAQNPRPQTTGFVQEQTTPTRERKADKLEPSRLTNVRTANLGEQYAQPAPVAPQINAVKPEAQSTPATAGVKTAPEPAAAQSDDGEGEVQWASKSGPASAGGGATPLTAGRINPTGHNLEMVAPVRLNKFHLGEVTVRISPKDEVSLPKKTLVPLIKPLLRPEAAATLESVAEADGHIMLTALKEKGFDLSFDPAQMAVFVNLTIEQRAIGNLKGSSSSATMLSENVSSPAAFTGFLNMHVGADYAFQPSGSSAIDNLRLDLQSAVRWRNVVLENEFALDSDGPSRRGTRLVYDLPDNALRFRIGDITPLSTSVQGGSSLLGASVEKSYEKLQPSRNIHPTGARSFRIERPSNVTLKMNGAIIKRLHLEPGDYNLDDLPLTTGANDVSLVIEDDVGQVRTLDFTVFFGRSLLAADVSEWALTAGVASGYSSGGSPGLENLYSELQYQWDTPMITGFYARGLTDVLTGEAHLQADQRVLMGGAGAFFQSPIGLWGVEGAASAMTKFGAGFTTLLHYDLSKFKGLADAQSNFRLTAEYISKAFAAAGATVPNNKQALNLSASYSQMLPWDISGGLSASYSLARDDAIDSFGADISLSHSFTPDVTAGLTLGYAHGLSHASASANDDMRASVYLAYRIDEKSSMRASHDNDAEGMTSQLSYRRQEENEMGAWTAQVETDREGASGDASHDSYNASGSLEYVGNRGEIIVSHSAEATDLSGSKVDQRTSVTAGTAIAFADGTFAIGRPISNSFAIIAPHPTLADKQISIGASQKEAQPSSGFFGPALASNLPAYAQSHLPVDVDDPPPGYDLGASNFDVYAPYKGGYRLVVGSDYTVSVHGTMLNDEGQPVSLLTGDAAEEGHPEGRHVQFFTNKAGKFGAQGLRPGRWVVEMDTEPKSRYVINVPEGTVGLLKVDTLRPEKRQG